MITKQRAMIIHIFSFSETYNQIQCLIEYNTKETPDKIEIKL